MSIVYLLIKMERGATMDCIQIKVILRVVYTYYVLGNISKPQVQTTMYLTPKL